MEEVSRELAPGWADSIMKLGARIMLLLCLAVAGTWVWRHWHRRAVDESIAANAATAATPLQAWAKAPPVKRAFYGRRLEPHDTVLHGAGQSDRLTFDAYSKAVAPARPMLLMRYVDLHDDLPKFFERLRADLGAAQDYLIPQIGISLNEGGGTHHYEAATAAGKDDAALEQICSGLQSLARPVFIRPGYEFNGPWNGYAAPSYVAAFRRVADAIHRCMPQEAAVVWDWSPDAELDRQRAGAPAAFAAARWQQFYPGDAYVDWWGVNLFSPPSISSEATREFLAEADSRRFPVMIAESTLRGASVHDPHAAIDQWFAPYFGLLRGAKGIKAFCYIDWDWRIYPQWADWGDARIESDATVLEFYRSQVLNASGITPWISGGADRATTRSILRLDGR